MEEDIFNLPELQQKNQLIEIKKCNEYTEKFGLTLSDAQIQALVNNRFEALKNNGRVEFGGGILQKLIFEFCDSPFIYQDNYVEMILGLQEAFYYFKNEAMDEVSDDELLRIMKEYFDTECQGSLEYLQETTLEEICRNIRYGHGMIRRLSDDEEEE